MDTRTIAELEAAGFGWLEARCTGCGHSVHYPFRLLKERHGARDDTRFDDAASRMRCSRCGPGPMLLCKPWDGGMWRYTQSLGHLTGDTGSSERAQRARRRRR
jgi:hypothetical protein